MTIAGVFMLLTYFYQINDTRFTLIYYPTLVVGVFGLLYGQCREAGSPARKWVRGAAVALAAAAVLVQDVPPFSLPVQL